MSDDSTSSRDARLRSALQRLGIAVFTIENDVSLQPFNRKAVEIFEREALRGDLVTYRPAHPFAAYIQKIVNARAGETVPAEVVVFPSGNRYRMEPSQKSEKGKGRMIMLLVEPEPSRVEPEVDLGIWNLTEREQDVARRMIAGESSEEITTALSIAPSTLKTHVKNILAKTLSRTRTEFVSKALTRR